MALATLLEAQRIGAEYLGIPFSEIQERQQPEVRHLGTICLDGDVEVTAVRALSGDQRRADDSLRYDKGGKRQHVYATRADALTDVTELSTEMWSKVLARGLGGDYIGGKTVLAANRPLQPAQRTAVMKALVPLMDRAGLSLRSIGAGDLGNGIEQIDAYAAQYHELHPADPYWQTVITGKSPELGGLEFRPAATGWGAYHSQLVAMEHLGVEHGTASVQGFGNVGAWYAHFASNDLEGRIDLTAISDADGTLISVDGTPIRITEDMVRTIGDCQGVANKIAKLKAAVESNQPGISLVIKDAAAILSHEVDWFVPAALPNVINDDTVGSLQITHGVIEAANGPTKPRAAQLLIAQKKLIVPDFIANGGGVDCSIIEHRTNLEMAGNDTVQKPTTPAVSKHLAEASRNVTWAAIRAAEEAGRPHDLRVGAAIVSLTAMQQLR